MTGSKAIGCCSVRNLRGVDFAGVRWCAGTDPVHRIGVVVRTEAGSLPDGAVLLPVFGGLCFADNSLTDHLRLWKKITPANAGKRSYIIILIGSPPQMRGKLRTCGDRPRTRRASAWPCT